MDINETGAASGTLLTKNGRSLIVTALHVTCTSSASGAASCGVASMRRVYTGLDLPPTGILQTGRMSSLERHPDEDEGWEDDWRWIVFVNLPTGQATWHIHDSELSMFDHLDRETGKVWDRHTTEEKYALLAELGETP